MAIAARNASAKLRPGAVGRVLAPEEIARLDEVSALPPEYPGWMVKRQAAHRLPEPPA